MATTTILLCGVGGQGTIFAADICAHVALEAGTDVKVSEIHGMAQRGGSVSTVVRFGDNVESMIADTGEADIVVSFETVEALRMIPFLKMGGTLLVNDESIQPLPVLIGKASMPDHTQEDLSELGAMLVPAHDLAVSAGSAKSVNVVMLGALSYFLDFPHDIWKEAIKALVPEKIANINLKALKYGRNFIKKERKNA